ncbi:MAG: dTDP-4-dehydrorhamnose reductase [Gemmatimonadales bacterium]
MKVGVTGSGGLLGRTLVPVWREAGAEVLAWTRADFDVTDAAQAARVIGAARPDAIVHAAAWTDVDGAEREESSAMRANRDGSANVAAAAAACRAALLHISTDYVFDGSARTPIAPGAAPAPLGAYARSKAAGETAVRESGSDWAIVRTGWAYGPHGRNFVDTMKQAANAGRSVAVVDDQVGAPTSVRLLAEALWALLAARARGIWHVAAAGETSWYGVARAVYEAAGADPSRVKACTSAEARRAAPRPAYGVLDCGATVTALGAPLAAWDEQVRAYVKTGALPACGLIKAAA